MRSEFIGMNVEIQSSGCGHFCGKIVDESKNTFTIHKGDREVIVPKAHSEFLFTYQGESVLIHGSEIQYRPEDRIKKIR
ncbi:ribonuclease P component 1 family protein [Candidatus Methanomassiliicoccus intestinalis]|uniref:ribonuclease P component 1 family protein n=1 Tax=Candidatus Methanomassiliicoccus intestinalis TaxID=1406512 RepID=UPI0037DD72CF